MAKKSKSVLDLSNVCHVLRDKILKTVERYALAELEEFEHTPDSLDDMLRQMDEDPRQCRAAMRCWGRATKLLLIEAWSARNNPQERKRPWQTGSDRLLTTAESVRYRKIRKLVEAELAEDGAAQRQTYGAQ